MDLYRQFFRFSYISLQLLDYLQFLDLGILRLICLVSHNHKDLVYNHHYYHHYIYHYYHHDYHHYCHHYYHHTHDNGGVAVPEDFTVTLTNIGPDGLVGGIDDMEVIQSFAPDASFSVEIPAGTYTLNEDGPDSYTTVMIAGDTACPSMEGEPFKLKKDTQITCTIYNDDNFVEGGAAGPAPTVSLNSTVVDPSLDLANDFTYVIGGVSAVNGSGLDGVNLAIPITANTPAFFNQTNNQSILPTKIIGDGNCPEVLAGEITLSSGQNITCTLVYGSEIEPGVVFHFNNILWRPLDPDTFLPNDPNDCSVLNTGSDLNLPCATLVGDTIKIADPMLPDTQKTLILFNILSEVAGSTTIAGCVVTGIGDSGRMTTSMEMVNEFILDCSLITDTTKPININYAFIETG